MMMWLYRIGAGGTLAAPVFLLHGRGIADGLFVLIGLAFLVRCTVLRTWEWLGRPWVVIALAWWFWLVLCSTVAGSGVGQALGVGRFLLLLAALERWVLVPAWTRMWLARLLRWSAFYLALQCIVQLAVGRNLFGWPRGADGELTGPYKNARAGAPLARLFFPALLPLARSPLTGLALFVGGIALMVLIGQRMPLLLTFLGLFVTALFLPRLRAPVMFAGAAALLFLSALPSISPEAAHRIETKFADQMLHWPESHYGLIAARSLAIARAHPVFGAGFDGFRRSCEDPAYFQGWGGGDGGGAAICVQHPHSYYLQALVEGGIPGLILFATLAGAWLADAGRGLFRNPDPLRVGLFAGALIQLWPVASSTDWVSMPLAGWFFLVLGLALAEARAYMPGQHVSIEA
jgi:O-antigen ligase